MIGEEQSFRADRRVVWVCDPIDGTIAFAMGEPTFMFSIALVVDGEPVLAVVSDLANGRIIEAIKGQGAFVDGAKMQVSTRSLEQAWIAFPTMLKWLFDEPALYSALSDAVYQTNIIHGGVFKGMLIAEGLSDGSVWVSDVHPWDMAAVKLIVEESGGRMTDREGNPQNFSSELNGVVVSNGVIHDSLLEIIKKEKL